MHLDYHCIDTLDISLFLKLHVQQIQHPLSDSDNSIYFKKRIVHLDNHCIDTLDISLFLKLHVQQIQHPLSDSNNSNNSIYFKKKKRIVHLDHHCIDDNCSNELRFLNIFHSSAGNVNENNHRPRDSD